MLRFYAVSAENAVPEWRRRIASIAQDFLSKSAAQQYTVNRSFVSG
jgi:hypothetical protein